ncbi:MAG: acetylglutamate kinase [Bacteroidota bacterium]
MTVVLKIGGNIINHGPSLATALDHFAALSTAAILVHGGGKKASELLQRMGLQPKMIDGRRITDAATLEVVTMVYAGLINKNIVAQLQARGTNAIGLSGADGNLMLAHQRPVKAIDYGFAGDVDAVNAALINHLLTADLRPIICPITHDKKGQLLNTNADTMAQETARALAQGGHRVSLRYCFELPGVMEDINRPDSVISRITPSDYAQLKAKGVITAGMIPKLDNAFSALGAGVAEVIIGNLTAMEAGKATVLVGA